MGTIDWNKLKEPFPASDIEWRVQQSGVKNDKGWAMVLAYVTNRAIQQRLDDVVGPENWRNEYSKGPDDGVLCGLSIRIKTGAKTFEVMALDDESEPYGLPANEYRYEWVTKYDGAENTQVEAVKGGLSGAMKRAAVQWGIGRYLYQLESTFAQTSDAKDKEHTEYLNVKDKTGKSLWTGYWAVPKLPAWALPTPEDKQAPDQPQRSEKPVEPRTEAPEGQGTPTLTADRVAELLALAKKKGYLDKKAAVDFLNVQAFGDFTALPASEFEGFKKLVIGSGWKQS